MQQPARNIDAQMAQLLLLRRRASLSMLGPAVVFAIVTPIAYLASQLGVPMAALEAAIVCATVVALGFLARTIYCYVQMLMLAKSLPDGLQTRLPVANNRAGRPLVRFASLALLGLSALIWVAISLAGRHP